MGNINLREHRARMALVQQEPVLFADSIAYNVEYGVEGKVKGVPDQGAQPADRDGVAVVQPAERGHEKPTEEVKVDIKQKRDYPDPSASVLKASKDANAHNFVSEMSDSYATFCGSRGTQVSGGQKQRISIGR